MYFAVWLRIKEPCGDDNSLLLNDYMLNRGMCSHLSSLP